jgi:hypothetical protein
MLAVLNVTLLATGTVPVNPVKTGGTGVLVGGIANGTYKRTVYRNIS